MDRITSPPSLGAGITSRPGRKRRRSARALASAWYRDAAARCSVLVAGICALEAPQKPRPDQRAALPARHLVRRGADAGENRAVDRQQLLAAALCAHLDGASRFK